MSNMRPSRVVVHFEDIDQVVRRFYAQHLQPALTRVHKEHDTLVIYQRYWEDPKVPKALPEIEVALSVRKALTELHGVQRWAFVVDLAPYPKDTPKLDYGINILDSLAREWKNVSLPQFLADSQILATILSVHAGTGTWGQIQQACANLPLTNVRVIEREVANDAVTAVRMVRERGPRIVIAERDPDNAWLADVIASWL